MPTAADLLTRLRDPSDEGLSARLAVIVVDDVLSTKAGELVDTRRVVDGVREAIVAWASDERAVLHLVTRLDEAGEAIRRHGAALADRVPPALRSGLRQWVQLPFAVRREAVLRVIDRESLRQLVRSQILQTVTDFGRRAASPVTETAIGRGLGKLAGQMANPLGALASAVSGEVERQIEKRASDFADTAVGSVLSGIAEQISDPARASQQAAMRLEILEGLLALTGADVADVAFAHLNGQVAVAREALTKWAASAEFALDLQRVLSSIVEREGGRPIGAILGDLGLRDAVAKHSVAVVRAELGRLCDNPAFAGWLAALLE